MISQCVDPPSVAAATCGVPKARRPPQRLSPVPTAGVPVLGEAVLRGWALLWEKVSE
jgi:hypothetical protein